MQDSELHGRANECNDMLTSDLAHTRRQSRSLYRNWVAVSKKSAGHAFPSQTNVMTRISTSTIGNEAEYITSSSCSLIEDRADEIVRHMEQSQTLMEDNPKSNIERIETLRVMTEYLTLKRSVKRKLIKSISPKCKGLSFSKRLKYRVSIFFSKIPVATKNFLTNFELWYSSLKVIEGHFGSSVASYFKFLRKLFLLNACLFILTSFFIIIPQFMLRFVRLVDLNETLKNTTDSELIKEKGTLSQVVVIRSNPYEDNAEFRLGNLFTGEGFLTNTILFYGYYTNTTLSLVEGYGFFIPAAYFFTSAVSYFIIFVFLFISVAVSYRKCYIETSGGMNNTFSNKIFCGWDFGIATRQAAELKSKCIYTEIKELLDEAIESKRKKSCAHAFYTTAISFSLNGILLFLLGVGGTYFWKYLDQQMTNADTATTMMIWLILTLIIAVAPVLFSLITHIEGFQSQSSALYMTLIRTFTLYAVVIAVIVAYRLNCSGKLDCWESILGQDMYRLVILDFIFGLIGTALSEFIRYRIFVKMWEGIGCPEFDIARSTMNLLYNQTLFYIGLYFSPGLSLIITIKLFLTFYIKKLGAIYNCKPFLKPWRANQAHTVYLSIAFFSFFCVVIAYGYIITSVKTSNCGPFRGGHYIYRTILNEILANDDSIILMILYYITRPGVVGIALMALLLLVYYMRAVALARIHVVNHLRQLLLLKAQDRKLLLNEISKYTKAQQSQINSKPYVGEGFSDSEYANVNSKRETLKNTAQVQVENANKFFDFEGPKASKLSAMSLTDLSGEAEKSLLGNRSSLFNSVQNISGLASNLNGKSKCKINKDKSLQSDAFQMVQLNRGSKVLDESTETDALKNLRKASSSNSIQDVETSDFTKENFENIRGNTVLNFNPVYTESFMLETNGEENNPLEDESDFQIRRFPGLNEEDPGNVRTRNDIRPFQERVPSRISFDSQQDSVFRRKKRH